MLHENGCRETKHCLIAQLLIFIGLVEQLPIIQRRTIERERRTDNGKFYISRREKRRLGMQNSARFHWKWKPS